MSQQSSFVPRQQAADGLKVYLKDNGRVALGTNKLTVRMAGQPAEASTLKFFEHHGLRLVEKLKLAPHLYVVETVGGADPLELAQKLESLPEIDSIEPQFIEGLGHR